MTDITWEDFQNLAPDAQRTVTRLDLRFVYELPEIFATLANHPQVRSLDLFGTRLAMPETLPRLGSLEELELGYNSLASVPKYVLGLSRLRVLGLADNRLRSLPPAIKTLPLERLDLTWNRFATIPKVVFELDGLRELLVGNDNFADVPAAISRLARLRTFTLTNSWVRAIPDALGELSELEHLELKTNTLLEALPRSIGRLRKLRTLVIVTAGLQTLPRELAELPALEELHLESLWLDEAAREIVNSIAGLRKLTVCNVTTPAGAQPWVEISDRSAGEPVRQNGSCSTASAS